MLKGLQNLNEWLGQLTDLAKMLVVIGIIVGILFVSCPNLEMRDLLGYCH